MKKILSVALLLAFLILLIDCGDPKPPIMPVDPCEKAISFNGSFGIFEAVGDSLVESDTILTYNSVVFRAAGEYDSYEWKVGTDDRVFTTRQFGLLFLTAEGKIDVTLKAKKKRDSQCFPNDPEETTVTKSFYIINWAQAPIIGRYSGYFGSDMNKTDRQVVQVAYRTDPSDPSSIYGAFDLININKGCALVQCPSPNPQAVFYHRFEFINRGARAVYFKYSLYDCTGCLNPIAWVKMTKDQGLTVKFSYEDRTKPKDPNTLQYARINDTFNGTRINP
jgi:hypothetical protein